LQHYKVMLYVKTMVRGVAINFLETTLIFKFYI